MLTVFLFLHEIIFCEYTLVLMSTHKIWFYGEAETLLMSTHKIWFHGEAETLLMSTHQIWFHGKIRLISTFFAVILMSIHNMCFLWRNQKKKKKKKKKRKKNEKNIISRYTIILTMIIQAPDRVYITRKMLHYESMPIQIYWKFYHQKMKIFR